MDSDKIKTLFTHFNLDVDGFTTIFKKLNDDHIRKNMFFSGGAVIASFLGDTIQPSQDIDFYIHTEAYHKIKETLDEYLKKHNYVKYTLEDNFNYSSIVEVWSEEQHDIDSVFEPCIFNGQMISEKQKLDPLTIHNKNPEAIEKLNNFYICELQLNNIKAYNNLIYKNYYDEIIYYFNTKTKQQFQIVLIKTDPKSLIDNFDLSICRMTLLLNETYDLYFGRELLYTYELSEFEGRIMYLYTGILMSNTLGRIEKYKERGFVFVDFETNEHSVFSSIKRNNDCIRNNEATLETLKEKMKLVREQKRQKHEKRHYFEKYGYNE